MERFYDYNQEEYPFDQLIANEFGVLVSQLDQLHRLIPEERQPTELFTQKNDSETWLHEQFYKRLHKDGWPELVGLYKKFICEVVKPIVGEDELIYQTTPTFRVHIPGNLAVGAFHKDKDYNHPPHEINFIIPLTKAFESNTLITESEPDKLDFRQIEMEPGQLLQFDGNNCLHGSLPNKTGVTRVSMDFRVMRLSDHDTGYQTESMTRKMKFVVGGYYERI